MTSQNSASANAETDGGILRPNTFWELIEKLLLNTTRDEQSRQRHNAALSALCRGHALPRLPREPKPKSTTKSGPKGRPPREELAVPNSIKGKKLTSKSISSNAPKEKKHVIRVSVTPTGSKTKLPQSDPKRCKSVDDCDKPVEAKSECLLNDHDIVYLKEDRSTPVRASERLWRYAIRNRKRCEEEDEREASVDKNKPIPSIRSNEAIFLGLRKRMEEANKEKLSKEQLIKEEMNKIQRRHSCQHIQKIRSDLTINNVEKVQPVRRSPSNTQPTQIELHKTFIKPARSVSKLKPGIHKSELGIKRSTSRDQMLSPWGQETGWPDLTKLAAVRSKNSFDSKKALYNSVIKRRLSCGHQLDTLNKDIITKKNSSYSLQSKETTRKYADLKSEYLNLCYQESSLRHQIALLHAEIYMMQNRGYHKRPATVKTITLDSINTPFSHNQDHVTEDGAVPMFPSLKAPRPLITSPPKFGLEKQVDKMSGKKRTSAKSTESREGPSDTSLPVLESVNGYYNAPVGVCSIYSLTPQIVTQPREPFTLPERKPDKLVHRLPRMLPEKGKYRSLYRDAEKGKDRTAYTDAKKDMDRTANIDAEKAQNRSPYTDAEKDTCRFGYTDAETDTYRSGYTDAETDQYRSGYIDAETDQYRSGYTDAETDQYRSGYTDAETDQYRSGYTDAQTDQYRSGYTDAETDQYRSGYTDASSFDYQPVLSTLKF